MAIDINVDALTSNDQVKFVICDRKDYEWAKQKLAEYNLDSRCEVLFSPVHGDIEARDLAEWILEDSCPCVCRCNYINTFGATNQDDKRKIA